MQVSVASLAVVPIKLIASFNRVKALTSDVSVVTSAMRRSNQPEVSGAALTSSTHPSVLSWLGIYLQIVSIIMYSLEHARPCCYPTCTISLTCSQQYSTRKIP